MHVHGSLSPVPCYSWACAVVWWARAGVSWPLWARLLSGPAADAVLLPSCRGEHKALEPKDIFLGGNRQTFSILFSPQIIPVPQILHKRCLKSTLKHIIANYTNVSDGLKRVVQSIGSLVIPPISLCGLEARLSPSRPLWQHIYDLHGYRWGILLSLCSLWVSVCMHPNLMFRGFLFCKLTHSNLRKKRTKILMTSSCTQGRGVSQTAIVSAQIWYMYMWIPYIPDVGDTMLLSGLCIM